MSTEKPSVKEKESKPNVKAEVNDKKQPLYSVKGYEANKTKEPTAPKVSKEASDYSVKDYSYGINDGYESIINDNKPTRRGDSEVVFNDKPKLYSVKGYENGEIKKGETTDSKKKSTMAGVAERRGDPAPIISKDSQKDVVFDNKRPKKLSQEEIKKRIVREAIKQGIPPEAALSIARAESNFKVKADAGKGGGKGIFQHVNSTWDELIKDHGKEHGIKPGTDQFDADASIKLGIEYIKEVAETQGLKPGDASASSTYLGYVLGPSGSKRLIAAPSGNADASKYASKAAVKRNPGLFKKKDGSNRTVDEFRALIQKKVASTKSDGLVISEVRNNKSTGAAGNKGAEGLSYADKSVTGASGKEGSAGVAGVAAGVAGVEGVSNKEASAYANSFTSTATNDDNYVISDKKNSFETNTEKTASVNKKADVGIVQGVKNLWSSLFSSSRSKETTEFSAESVITDEPKSSVVTNKTVTPPLAKVTPIAPVAPVETELPQAVELESLTKPKEVSYKDSPNEKTSFSANKRSLKVDKEQDDNTEVLESINDLDGAISEVANKVDTAEAKTSEKLGALESIASESSMSVQEQLQYIKQTSDASVSSLGVQNSILSALQDVATGTTNIVSAINSQSSNDSKSDAPKGHGRSDDGFNNRRGEMAGESNGQLPIDRRVQ